MTDQEIEKAVNIMTGKAPIVREFWGYIVLAQSDNDFELKSSSIRRGDTRGFYTVERVLWLHNKD